MTLPLDECPHEACSSDGPVDGPWDPEPVATIDDRPIAELPPRQREAIACRYLRRMSIRPGGRCDGLRRGDGEVGRVRRDRAAPGNPTRGAMISSDSDHEADDFPSGLLDGLEQLAAATRRATLPRGRPGRRRPASRRRQASGGRVDDRVGACRRRLRRCRRKFPSPCTKPSVAASPAVVGHAPGESPDKRQTPVAEDAAAAGNAHAQRGACSRQRGRRKRPPADRRRGRHQFLFLDQYVRKLACRFVYERRIRRAWTIPCRRSLDRNRPGASSISAVVRIRAATAQKTVYACSAVATGLSRRSQLVAVWRSL